MKIGAVAKVLEVPVPTIRRWTQEFADGLTPGARAGDGAVRSFTHPDVLLLRTARDLLQQDMTYAAVRRKLAELGLLKSPAPADREPAPGPQDEEEREVAVRFVRSVIDDVMAPHLARIAALEQQVRELRESTAGSDASARRRWPFKG